MPAPQESFDLDALISLEAGIQREALEAFFQGIANNADDEERREIARFARRGAWRMLPDILADESPGFEPPIKRYVFAASCHALFATATPSAVDITEKDLTTALLVANAALDGGAAIATNAALAAHTAAFANVSDFAAAADAGAENKPLRQPLLLSMRADLVALHSRQTLAGQALWPEESASQFDVGAWFSEFDKNVERFEMGSDILRIYQAVLDGSIDEVIHSYPPDLFESLLKSTRSDYEAWKRDHPATGTDDSEESSDEPAKEIKIPRADLHSDAAAATDHLDRERLAQVLSDWLEERNSQSHTAIGLFGDWGLGKSTFVNLLRKRLKIPLDRESANDEKPSTDHYKEGHYIGGEFNAWEYEHTDNIQAGLAQELITALQANLKWWEKAWLTSKFAVKHNWFKLLIGLGIVVLAVIVYIIGLKLDFPWFSGLAGIAGLAAIWNYGTQAIAHPLAKEFRTYLRLPSFGKELGTIPVMREQVKAMVNLRLNHFKEGQRLLFVIDDLDRCSPDAVVQVLEAARLVLDLPNVIVLIAIDQKVALASLALRYDKLAIHYGTDPKLIARQYLGKVIHVPITLENPSPEAVKKYLEQNLWAGDAPSAPADKVEPKGKDASVVSGGEQPSKTTADDPAKKTEPKQTETQEPSPKPAPEKPAEDDKPEQPVIESVGLSQGQKDDFIDWANKFGLANPRHIKRLDNAYNLIRKRYPDEDQSDTPNYRLVMLLWIEYCRELPLDTRSVLSNYRRAEMAEKPEDALKSLRDQLDTLDQKAGSQIGPFWDKVKAIWADKPMEAMKAHYHQMRTFVLPAIEPNQ